ncbi:MAG: glucose-6-phosphate isomerase, partial [Burkholderiaceae bacterium]
RAAAPRLDGQDIGADVQAVLERMGAFAERVRGGDWRGHDGRPISDIVHIGIGGSFLGPKMACQALRPLAHPRLRLHFVSNVDGHDLAQTLAQINAATTLFVIASKTFTTQETMMNARSARAWFLRSGAREADLARHFVAVSTNTGAVTEFGIDAANMFPLWDWVGGRYSIWSAIGLPLMLAIGPQHFARFLAGAHAMDCHFRQAPLEANMPVLLAAVGIWNRDFLGCSSLSVAPYHQDLRHFPAYLQQLEMESNGKRVTEHGATLAVASCPVIWGDVGSNGQHAFFQLLHQGSDVVPVDFIAVLRPAHELPGHHAALLANCFAQSEALMRGKSAEQEQAEMRTLGIDPAEAAALAPHRSFPGNRPSNTLLLDELTPATLGALVALYEHKVFVQGVIWGLDSFDQWGVELGKTLARDIEAELTGTALPQRHDSSTNGLIARARAAR